MYESERVKPDALVFSLSYQGDLISSMNPDDAYECTANAISKAMYLEKDNLWTRSRKGLLPFARHAARFWMKKLTNLSLEKIASKTGGVDHATVLHSIKAYENWVETSKKHREIDARIKRHLAAEQAKMGFELSVSNHEETISNWEKIKNRHRG